MLCRISTPKETRKYLTCARQLFYAPAKSLPILFLNPMTEKERGAGLLLTHVSVKSEIPMECWHLWGGTG
jgi:hypothetical protein